MRGRWSSRCSDPRKRRKPWFIAATDGLGVTSYSRCPDSVSHSPGSCTRSSGRPRSDAGIPSKPIELDLPKEVIFKGITIYGVVGRKMYDTWHQMTRFLRSGEFDPTPVITHRFPMADFEAAIAAIKSGDAGKVIFEVT